MEGHAGAARAEDQKIQELEDEIKRLKARPRPKAEVKQEVKREVKVPEEKKAC